MRECSFGSTFSTLTNILEIRNLEIGGKTHFSKLLETSEEQCVLYLATYFISHFEDCSNTNLGLRIFCDFFKISNVLQVVVLEPWEDPIPLTRSWCLWEIYSSVSRNVDLHIRISGKERASLVEVLFTFSDKFFFARLFIREFSPSLRLHWIIRFEYIDAEE